MPPLDVGQDPDGGTRVNRAPTLAPRPPDGRGLRVLHHGEIIPLRDYMERELRAWEVAYSVGGRPRREA